MASTSAPLGGLRIGWFEDDGFALPTPACARAVREAAAALEGRGQPWAVKSFGHRPVFFTSVSPYKTYRVASESLDNAHA